MGCAADGEGDGSMERDEALYRQYLSGDERGLSGLMERYGDRLTLYLYGYLHSWEVAEDLMIEAFARIMVKKPEISDGGFRAYLFKTARNLAARFHKQQRRLRVFSFEDLSEELTSQVLTEEFSLNREKKEILRLCFDRIGPEYSEALWLVYVEELSYEQASAVMNINVKKLDNLLSRGKMLLRTELGKEGVTDTYE